MKKVLVLAACLLLPLLTYAQLASKGANYILRRDAARGLSKYSGTHSAQSLVLNAHKNLTLDKINKKANIEVDWESLVVNKEQADKVFYSLIHDNYHFQIASKAHVPLNNRAFPKEVIQNNHLKDFLYRAEYVARLNYIRKNAAEVAQSTKMSVVPGSEPVDYTRFIPATTNILFVGESHTLPPVREEIFLLLNQLRKRDPSRKIVLLTEFVDKSIESTSMLRKALEQHTELDIVNYKRFMKRLADSRIEIVGLEDLRGLFTENVLVWFKTQEQSPFRHSRVYVEKRNSAWAEIIKKQRRKNPTALFVVYTGAAHVSYSWLDNLPSMLPAYEGYVINFISPHRLKYISSFWDYLYPQQGPELWNLFYMDPKNKLLVTLSKPNYRKLLGADATLVLHGQQRAPVKLPFRTLKKP